MFKKVEKIANYVYGLVMKLRFFISLLLLILIPLKVWGYASVTVPVTDPVYRKLDNLAAFGLIKTMILGQRPYVRTEVARLIAEAMKNYPEFEKKYRENPDLSLRDSKKMLDAKVSVDRILKRLKELYRKELIQRGVLPGEVPTFDGRPMEYLGADYIYLDEPKQVFLPDNGTGGINGLIQPLVENRQGRHYQSGHNWNIGSRHWVRMTKYVALQFEQFFQGQIAQMPNPSENDYFVQRLNAHFTVKNVDVEVGRDSINWGASPRGSLGFTMDPRPLDFIKLSGASPFHFPFFFRNLGLFQMSLVVANLGPDYLPFKNPFLVAYKISSQAMPEFEMGISQLMLIGGSPSPSGSFGQGVLDFFNVAENENRVNRAYNLEFIGRIPQLRNSQIYAEISFGDFTSNMKTLWGDNTSYLIGMYVPRLTFRGNANLRIEYRRLAKRYSRSQLYTDGMTENSLLIGDPLGPDSQGILALFEYEVTPHNQVDASVEWQSRNSDTYTYQGTDLIKVSNGNTENRVLYRFGLRHLFNNRFVGHIGFGLEQVYDAGFITGNDQFNWMGEVGIRFYMDDEAQL